MTPAEQLRESVLSLQTAMLEAHPQMPTLLQQIHRKLKECPEIVTILEEEEIAIIVEGLKKQTNTMIATTVAKSRAKPLKAMSIGDL